MEEVKAVSVLRLEELSQRMYGGLVKAVVDIEQQRMVIDAEMHADEESYLLENGSLQKDLWGINLHPAYYGTDDFIEFDSMINIRPIQNNRSRSVEDPNNRRLIHEVVAEKVYE